VAARVQHEWTFASLLQNQPRPEAKWVRDREFREDLYYRLNAFRFIFRRYAKGKADIPSSWNTSFNQSADSCRQNNPKTIPEETMRAWFATLARRNIRSGKTYHRARRHSLNDGIFEPGPTSRNASRWSQRLRIRRLKIKGVERSSLLASAPIGNSEVREEPPPDSA